MKNFTLALIALSFSGLAQPLSRSIQSVVQTAESKTPGVWQLELSLSEGLTLTDSIGFVVGLNSSSPYRNKNISAVSIEKISGKSIKAIANTYDEIKLGDVVVWKYSEKSNAPFQGKLFLAASNGLYVSGSDGQPYYSWAQILSGTKTWEGQVLAKMLVDIKKSPAGASATLVTIQNFITSLERVPQIYFGRNLNLNDEYSIWVKTGSIDYSVIDHFVKALSNEKNFENARTTHSKSVTSDFLINLANAENIKYSSGGAIETYLPTMQAIALLAPKVLTGEGLGYVHFSNGSVLDLAKKYAEAVDQYVVAANSYQGKDDVQYARTISRVAEDAKQLGAFDKAAELFSQGSELWRMEIAKKQSAYNYSRLRISLEGLALCQEELQQYEPYISTYQELTGVYKKLRMMYEKGNAFWNIGYTYAVKLEQAEPANKNYERAYQVFDSIKSVKNAVTMICNQAVNYRNLKNFKVAHELGLRAEAYAKANMNVEAEGHALNNIMATYKAENKKDKALEVARKMEKLYITFSLPKNLATTKDEIATMSDELGKKEEAIKASEEALAIYKEIGNAKELADAYWNAGYYVGNRNVELSNGYYTKALEYYRDQPTSSAATLFTNIGVNYRDINEKDKSYLAHKEAIEFGIAQKDTVSIIYSLEKLYNTTVHFKDHAESGEMGILMGRLYVTKGDNDKAIEWGNKVVDEMEKAITRGDDNKLAAALAKSKAHKYLSQYLEAGQALEASGRYATNWPDAFRYYKEAVSLLTTQDDPTKPDPLGFRLLLDDIYIEMAKGYKQLKKYDSAKMMTDKSLAFALEKKDDEAVHNSYKIQAQILEDQNKSQEALNVYAKAEMHGTLDNKMTVKKSIGKLLTKIKRYDQAEAKYKERLATPTTNSTLDDIYWDLGYTLSFVPSRLKESNDYYIKCSAIYKKGKEWGSYVSVMNNIAVNYSDSKDSVNCYKVGREVVATLKPKKPTEPEATHYYKALENLGSYYKTFGHHSKAMKARAESADGFALLGNNEKANEVYEFAGNSANETKQYLQAQQYFTLSKDYAIKLGDKKKIASALWSLGYNRSSYQKKYPEAIKLYEEAYTNYLEAGDTANASVMRSNIGQNYWSLLDFDKAIETHYQAIDIATKGKYMTQVASSWRKLADLFKETKNPTRQSEAMTNAINTLEILKDTTELLPAYIEIGTSYSDSKETGKAEKYFNNALNIAIAKKDSLNISNAYYKFAGLYHGEKNALAKLNYEKSIAIQRKTKDKANLIYSLASEGSLLVESDRPLSEKLLNEALGIAKELKDDNIIAYSHRMLYFLYREIGKPEEAHKHIDTALKLYKGLDNKVSLVDLYISSANEYLYDYGDFQKAQDFMGKAKQLLDSINNPLSFASFHSQQGSIYEDQGQYDLALAERDKANEIYTTNKNEWGLAGLYIGYGNIYKSIGEYALSLKFQNKSDSLYTKLNVPYQCLAPIANIGTVYSAQGDYPKALDYFKRSLKLIEDNKDMNTNLCKLYSMLGETYMAMTDYAEAEKWLMKSLETTKKISATRTGADVLIMLGKLKIETKKYDEAEKHLLEAKAFHVAQNLKVELTSNVTQLGHLYLKKGELEKAKTELAEAIELAEKFGKDAVLWEAYFRMGSYYRQSKNLPEAKNYLLKSVGVIDKLRGKIVGGEEAQKLFSSDKWILEAYEELISVFLELGDTEEAMAWLHKINENNVRDKIRSMDVTFEDEEKNKALSKEKELKMKLDAMEKQIAASKQAKNANAEQIKNLEATRNIAEGDYLKFVNQTVNVQPELSKYFSNTVQPSQLKGKKKQIPKDMALVSYLVGEKQLYIFVATSDTVVARIVSVTKEKIHRDVNAMTNITRTHLGNFGTIDLATSESERKELVQQAKQTDQMLKPFEEAYHYLIAPISEVISSKARLGIIPTGELNYIPFQMLGKTLKNNKFSLLINQFSMFYTNSTDMLLRTVTGVKELNILAFGNPDKTLPATEKEVNDIKKIFPNTKVYVQGEASEDKAKFASEEYNVMHFATHGNLDYEDFSKSYLTMAANVGMKEDGMLTLEELWGMEVMSHLNIVVLSACQTAVTKGSDESSPVSPASGFLQNGVKSVVATLWKVDDEATSILMNDFYKNIKTMDAVDAMRIAQSNLSKNPKFNHPYYWAAMVLIGDWR